MRICLLAVSVLCLTSHSYAEGRSLFGQSEDHGDGGERLFGEERGELGHQRPFGQRRAGEAHSSGSKGEQLKRFFQSLNLSDEQRRKLLDLKRRQEKLREASKEIQKDREKFRSLMRKKNAHSGAVLDQFDAVQKRSTKLQRERLRNILELKEILNPKQFRAVQERLRQRHQKKSPR